MTMLHKRVTDEIEHFVPIKTYNVNPKKAWHEPWLTTGIHTSIRKCKKLYCQTLHKNASTAVLAKYKAYATLLQCIKRHSKMSYYGEKCSRYRHNTKKLWDIINDISSMQNNKGSLIDCLKINNVLEYNATRITNRFGEYFSSVGEKFSKRVANPVHNWRYYCDKIERNAQTLFMAPCTELEILRMINKLPSKTSSGHDNISYVILKTIGEYLVVPLTQVFNDSMNLGKFPDIMKLADVVPLYKSKEKYLETNY